MSPSLAFGILAFQAILGLFALGFMVDKPRERLTVGAALFLAATQTLNLVLTYSLYLGATS